MAWLDDRIRDHPKMIGLSDAAFRAWILALTYCSQHATGGHLEAALRVIRVRKRVENELVSAGLWDRESDGLWIHDWQEHNEKRDASADERRAQARERQRRHRERVRSRGENVTRDSHETSRVTERDSHGVTERDSPTRARARAREARARSSHHDQDKPSSSARLPTPGVTPPGDDAAEQGKREGWLGRLAVAGWSGGQIDTVLEQGDHDRAIAWLEHAESNPRTRNAGGLAWSGYASNVWPPEARLEIAPGAQGPRSTTVVHPHVCPRCELSFKTEQRLVEHLEVVHDDTSRSNGREPEPVVELELRDV